MPRRLVSSIVTASMLALPSLVLAMQEHAAEAAEDHQGAIANVKQGVYTAATALVVFLIVLTVLAVKVWPTITKALDERANKIKGEIEAAESARKAAKEALDQYQSSLAQARAEAQKEIDKARAQAQVISAELRAKADVDLANLREKALKDIDAARRAAAAELYSESANLATMIAGKILRREVSVGDRQKLVDESVAQLQNSRN